jgi:hypothetical protein
MAGVCRARIQPPRGVGMNAEQTAGVMDNVDICRRSIAPCSAPC